MHIEAVIFDLGRVLVRVDFTRGLFPHLDGNKSKTDEDILEEVLRHPALIDFCTGRIDAMEMYRTLKTMFKVDMDFDRFRHLWCDVFSPMDGMEMIISRIASSPLALGLLSDTDPMHWHFVREHYSFLKQIEKPTLSFEIGAMKPAALCYLKAAENVGKDPEKCLFIDDRIINVEGARKTGMQAIHFLDVSQVTRELREWGVL